MSDEPHQIERKRAKITASAPPPRIVHYVNTRQEVEEDEDDEPVARKPKRSPMASLIIFAGIGGFLGFFGFMAFRVIVSMEHSGKVPRNLATPFDRLQGAVLSSLPLSLVTFIVCGGAGALLWAITRPKK